MEANYLVVGVTEDLVTFFEVLEFLLPHIFYNATNVHKNIGMWEHEINKPGIHTFWYYEKKDKSAN